MDDAIPVSTRLRRSTPYHDAYTVRVYDDRFAALATARPADARRWVATTRWLHGGLIHRGRLIVGLGVQWTPTRARARLHGGETTPVPATLQLCVGHRCLVFHLARADAVPEALRRFLADPRVTFVGSGAAHDGRMLWEHWGLRVAHGRELRAAAGMGNASVEQMAGRFLGYPGICKPREVAMSAWHAPRLERLQVQYAAVDAYLAFRLGVVLLCPGNAPPPHAPARVQQRPPVQRVPAPRALVAVHAAPPAQRARAVVDPAPRAPVQRPPAVVRQARAPVIVMPHPAFIGVPRGLPVRAYASDSDYSDSSDGFNVFRDEDATRGLPVRAYASDSDYSDSSDGSSDGFNVFRDEDEDDGSYSGTDEDNGSYTRTDNVDGNGDEDEEDEEGCNNADDQEVSAELVSGEVVIGGCKDEEYGVLAQGDWYDDFVVDCGFDQDDEEFEEFYLL